jgi:hypothetical protein
MFKDYLDENNLDASALTRKYEGPIITEQWKIIPVVDLVEPGYDDRFEQLSGPFLTINDDNITGFYNVVDQSISIAKSKLKTIVTDTRWRVETGKLTFTFADGETVQLFTSREDRVVYLDALLIMGDTDTVTFKFVDEKFRAVTKSELTQIVTTGSQHIKDCFRWEAEKHAEIDLCTTLDELKLINLTHPSEV